MVIIKDTTKVSLADLNMNIVLLIYVVLALEYDLYNFFHFGFIIPGSALTAIEIILLIFVILTTKQRVKSHYIMYCFLILGIIGTYLFTPECSEYLQALFWDGSSLKKVFLLPIAVQCIKMPNKFVDRLYYFSVIEGYIHVICNAIWGYGYNEWGVFNYMTYGMALITPTCLVMQRVFFKPSKWNILTITIFGLNILIYGHRGALLVLMFMAVIFFIKYIKTDKKILFAIVGILTFFILFAFKNVIVEEIISLMDSFDIESRTLEKFLSGDITNDSERNTIWAIVGNGILSSFPFGNGIGADRILLEKKMRYGLYAHNFIFEICFNFGVILGGIIVICILVMLYKSLTHIEDEEWYRLIVPFFVPSVITLLTSGSIYQYWLFWLSVGFYFGYFGRKKNVRKILSLHVAKRK